MRQSLFYFLSGAGKFSPAHGLRQLTCDGKSGVESLNFMSHATYIRHHEKPNDVRRRSLCDIKCQKLKKLLMVNYNFQCHREEKLSNVDPRVNGKCRKLGKPRLRHYPFTLGLGFLGLHQRPMIDSIYLASISVATCYLIITCYAIRLKPFTQHF